MSKYVVARVFGASECKNCKALLSFLDAKGVFYDFIDAFAEETQDYCDEHGVDDLPHVQLLSEGGDLIHTFVGEFDHTELLKSVNAYEKNRNNHG